MGMTSPLGSFARHGTGLLALRVAGILLQFAVYALVARALELQDLGTYAVVYAVWAAWRVFGTMGLDHGMLRAGSALHANDDPSHAFAFERHALRRGCIAAAVILGVVAVPSSIWASSWGGERLVAAALFGAVLLTVIGICVGILRARRSVAGSQLPESIALPSITAGVIVISWSTGGTPTLETVLFAHVLGLLLTAALYLHLVVRDWSALGPEPDGRALQDMARTSNDVLLSQSILSLANRLPVPAAALMLPSADVAILDAGIRFGQLASVMTWAIAASSSPYMAILWERRERDGLQRLLSAASAIAAACAASVLILLLLWGGAIIGAIAGPTIAPAQTAACVIALGLVVNGAAGLSADALFMSGNSRPVVFGSSARLAVLVSSMLLLAPSFAVEGFAMAVLLGIIARDVPLSWVLHRRTGIAGGVWTGRTIEAARDGIREIIGGGAR